MQIFTDRDHAPLAGLRPVATLGVFDGVHRGHIAIIARVLQKAREMSVPGVALTFGTHPRMSLGRSSPPGICSLDKRLRLLERAGLDAVWVLSFTPEFAAKSAREFAQEYFVDRLGASAVVLGEGAVFGRGRTGSAATLAGWLAQPVLAVPPLMDGQTVVSSTAVRLAVQAADLARAARLLGRPVSVAGTVVHGQGRGHEFGFPTINLDPFHELRPPAGVYHTLAVIDGRAHPSVTNIGRPPTDAEIDAGLADYVIESHLLDFDGDLYGRTAELFFLHKSRDVMLFPRESGLIRRIGDDLAEARRWFAGQPAGQAEEVLRWA